VPVIVYPAAVQGDTAPGELIDALASAVRRNECDVLIIGRGGGSLEDLWAFNDEALARAIADCPIPVVSAVGHEVDFTIADFVADLRAPTPSGAAELVVPNREDWLHRVNVLAARVGRAGQRQVEDRAQTLDWLARRLLTASPANTLRRQVDRLREGHGRLAAAMRRRLLEQAGDLQELRSGLLQASPALAVQRSIARFMALRHRLAAGARKRLDRAGHRLALLARGLNSISPLATLERGYAIVQDAKTGRALLRAGDVVPGDEILARLSEGQLHASVTKVTRK